MKKESEYYIIIDNYVLINKELTGDEKILWGHINTLQRKEGYCWASNSHLSEQTGVHKNTVSKRINRLKELGFINVSLVYKEGGKCVEKRIITLIKPINATIDTYQSNEVHPINATIDTLSTEQSIPYQSNEVYPINHTVEVNSTSINSTSINSTRVIETAKPFFDNIELNDLFKDFLDLRKSLKAKNTDRAIKLLINKLSNYSIIEKTAMIEQSIESSWKGVFPIKKQYNNKKEPESLSKYYFPKMYEEEKKEDKPKEEFKALDMNKVFKLK